MYRRAVQYPTILDGARTVVLLFICDNKLRAGNCTHAQSEIALSVRLSPHETHFRERETKHRCYSSHKSALSLALIPQKMAPSNCPCGHPFSTQHVLSCLKGGYPSIRHNELRDFTASLLSETCHGVAVEPSLQPVTSESLNGASANRQGGARLDIVASGFWGSTFERAFFDVRVFNPFAPSNRHSSIAASYLPPT